MKNLIWSLFAVLLVGTITLSSCGDGGKAAAAEKAKMEKMKADSIANAAAEAKAKFEADSKAAIERLGTQMNEIKEKMGAEGVTDEAKAEMQTKLDQLTAMVAKLKENMGGAAEGAMDAAKDAAGAAGDAVKDAAGAAKDAAGDAMDAAKEKMEN